MTGLAESQISPTQRDLIERGYLTLDGVGDSGARAFILENPLRADMQQHVAITTSYLRGKQAARRADRRAHAKAVTPNDGGTEDRLSHQKTGVTSHQIQVAISPEYTPQNIAPKGGLPIKFSTALSNEGEESSDLHPTPANEHEAEALIEQLRAGRPVTPAVMHYWRKKAAEDLLTEDIVEAYYGGRRA